MIYSGHRKTLKEDDDDDTPDLVECVDSDVDTDSSSEDEIFRGFEGTTNVEKFDNSEAIVKNNITKSIKRTRRYAVNYYI